MYVLTKESNGWEKRIMVTDATRYRQLIDAALAYRDACRRKKGLR